MNQTKLSFLIRNTLILMLALIISLQTRIIAQANLIQAIDFDSQNRVIYSLTGFYDSSYVVRYSNYGKEIWNMTNVFNQDFYWISSCVDSNDNIWAYLQNNLYRYDGLAWSEIPLPINTLTYQKYSDLAAVGEQIYLSLYLASSYGYPAIYIYSSSGNSWKAFDTSNSDLPDNFLAGKIFVKGDSVFISSSKGLILIENDSAFVILDTLNSSCLTQAFYTFFIDNSGRRWIGSFDKGLVEWIDNNNFRYFNQSNSALPNNFINAIDEDEYGNIWIATDNGFARLKNDTIYSYSNLSNNSIAELKVDDQNRVWMGEVGTGNLLLFDGNSLTTITYAENIFYESSPSSFLLYQNYPNPFNPSTKIGFVIPNELNNRQAQYKVSLRVYDLLGNEVATLLNEEKSPGYYEVELSTASSGNALNLSSGIYLYRLEAGNFAQTKKMILIR